MRRKMFLTGCVLLAVLMTLAVLVPAFSPYSYSEQNAGLRNLNPSLSHWFGTDRFGRDLFTRVWCGARLSLCIGLGSAAICGTLGMAFGAVAGYFGGLADCLVMRAADVADAIPSLLYVVLLTLALGANVQAMILGICISGWSGTARMVRGEVMRLRTSEFVQAARLTGASPWRVIWYHLLPNAMGALIVSLTFFVPKAIFTEAFLSFAGVGIAAPAASLGALVWEGRRQLRLYPGQMLYPAFVLCLLVVALHLIGAGLEEGDIESIESREFERTI